MSNEQGVHTTSISSLYELQNNTKIIDSPGMRDIEIKNYSKDHIISGFEEILEASKVANLQIVTILTTRDAA